jgi:outer membrane protein TolC
MKQMKIVIQLLIFLYLSLWGQGAISTLEDCLKYAYQHDLRLKISTEQKRMQRLEWQKSRNQRLPKIQVMALYNRIGEVTSFTMPVGPNGERRKFEFGTRNRMSMDVKLSMPLFTWGRLSSGIRLNQKMMLISELQVQRIKNQITEQVIRLYLSVALNQSVLKIRLEDWERSRENLKTARLRYTKGNVSELHVIRAQAEVEKVKNSLEEIRTNLINTLLALSSLTGMDTSAIRLHPKLKMVDFEALQETLEHKILSDNTRFQELRIQTESMRERWKIAKAVGRPMILAVAGYNVMNGFDPVNPEKFVDNWNAGIQITIPLFDGWESHLNAEQINIQKKQLELQRESLFRELQLKYRQKVGLIRQSRETVFHMEKIIQASQKAYQVAVQQYKQGFMSQLDLINARFQYTQSELLKQQALFTYLMNVLDICALAEDFSVFHTYFE